MVNIRIAVDLMGGDFPLVSSLGAVKIAIARHRGSVNFVLFGDLHLAQRKVPDFPFNSPNITFIHTEEFIANNEKPSSALRKSKKTSMGMAVLAVANAEADASVSAGNTGALMAISKVFLRVLPGIDRPAICSFIPSKSAMPCVMLDMGANVVCDANQLFQFALMGSAFFSAAIGVARPTIALLNIGEEEMKGRDEIKGAVEIIKASSIGSQFIGYVEPDAVLNGTANVVVADGFSGNIMIKSMSAVAKLTKSILKDAYSSTIFSKLGYLFSGGELRRHMKKIDSKKYNGAMFVGLNGISIKSHGSADEVSFAYAIDVAISAVMTKINQTITKSIAASVGGAKTSPGGDGTNSSSEASSSGDVISGSGDSNESKMHNTVAEVAKSKVVNCDNNDAEVCDKNVYTYSQKSAIILNNFSDSVSDNFLCQKSDIAQNDNCMN